MGWFFHDRIVPGAFWKMVRAWPRNFGKFQTHVEVELQTLKAGKAG